MDIWVVGTLNKYIVVPDETPFFMIVQFCTYHSICPNIGFRYGSFVWK